MQWPKRVLQLFAWLVIALLLAVPLWVLMAPWTANIAWAAWAVVSVWAALYAVPLATYAFPKRHSPSLAFAITALAVVNGLCSIGLVVFPKTG
jgi:hypothetical protein